MRWERIPAPISADQVAGETTWLDRPREVPTGKRTLKQTARIVQVWKHASAEPIKHVTVGAYKGLHGVTRNIENHLVTTDTLRP